ncbi:hypothetical protein [Rhizobium sp. BK376]|uniref:DUF3885 domain-containing protein n=1 Tax=Rhizobium sp. BK376 TaxID=2512149 RepID=UPI00104E1454|nr:hypothetical protein [Rhizobium sp. BK376]TCR67887.1 hypothetical protein EV561_1472 [Rhizobium sp. BK376]
MKSSLTESWREQDTAFQRRFGTELPFAWLLRKFHAPEWIRFYALPQAQRAVETSDDNGEAIRRFHEIATALFGELNTLVMVLVPIRKFNGKYGRYKLTSVARLGFHLIVSDLRDETDDSGIAFDLYGGMQVICSDNITRLTSLAMTDEVLQFLLVSDAGEIIAPYDGGFDIICSNIERRDQLKHQFSDWISPRHDGL